MGEYSDAEANRCAYEVSYTYEKSIKLGYALSSVKSTLER
jgi:hypothetical protein